MEVEIGMVTKAGLATGTIAATANLLGFSLGVTTGIGVGALVAGGLVYFLYKYCHRTQQAIAQEEVSEGMVNFKMPILPEQPDNFSDLVNNPLINTKQLIELQQEYLCSISFTLMVEPVLGTCCNKRYYQKVVFEAIIEQLGACPFCRENITRKNMTELPPLKASIRSFRKKIVKKAQKMQQQKIEDGLNEPLIKSEEIQLVQNIPQQYQQLTVPKFSAEQQIPEMIQELKQIQEIVGLLKQPDNQNPSHVSHAIAISSEQMGQSQQMNLCSPTENLMVEPVAVAVLGTWEVPKIKYEELD